MRRRVENGAGVGVSDRAQRTGLKTQVARIILGGLGLVALAACHFPSTGRPLSVKTYDQTEARGLLSITRWTPTNQEVETGLSALQRYLKRSNLRSGHPLRKRFGDYALVVWGEEVGGKKVIQIVGTSDPVLAQQLSPHLVVADAPENYFRATYHVAEDRVVVLLPAHVDPLP